MTNTTVVHDPINGTHVGIFLRADHVHAIVHAALRLAVENGGDLWSLDDVLEVHACLDPFGMPDGTEGRPVWCVPPEPMWRLLNRCKTEDRLPDGWNDDEAYRTTQAVLLADFPELAWIGEVDEEQREERIAESVRRQLEGSP